MKRPRQRKMMYSASCDDVPSTIVCHFFSLEHKDYDEDVMNFSSSSTSSLYDSRHLIEDNMSHATEVRGDHVTGEDLRAMKEMVASMRRNPDLLHQSPIMRRASCLTATSPRRHTTDKAPPNETDVVKDEDLCAMKDMIASMRKNPILLYQSPVMQKACFLNTVNTTRALTHDTPSLISSYDTTTSTLPTSDRRPLGTKFDPSTLPSLPFETPQCTQFEPCPPSSSSGSMAAIWVDTDREYDKDLEEVIKSAQPRSRRMGSIVEVSNKRVHASDIATKPPRNPSTAAARSA